MNQLDHSSCGMHTCMLTCYLWSVVRQNIFQRELMDCIGWKVWSYITLKTKIIANSSSKCSFFSVMLLALLSNMAIFLDYLLYLFSLFIDSLNLFLNSLDLFNLMYVHIVIIIPTPWGISDVVSHYLGRGRNLSVCLPPPEPQLWLYQHSFEA